MKQIVVHLINQIAIKDEGGIKMFKRLTFLLLIFVLVLQAVPLAIIANGYNAEEIAPLYQLDGEYDDWYVLEEDMMLTVEYSDGIDYLDDLDIEDNTDLDIYWTSDQWAEFNDLVAINFDAYARVHNLVIYVEMNILLNPTIPADVVAELQALVVIFNELSSEWNDIESAIGVQPFEKVIATLIANTQAFEDLAVELIAVIGYDPEDDDTTLPTQPTPPPVDDGDDSDSDIYWITDQWAEFSDLTVTNFDAYARVHNLVGFVRMNILSNPTTPADIVEELQVLITLFNELTSEWNPISSAAGVQPFEEVVAALTANTQAFEDLAVELITVIGYDPEDDTISLTGVRYLAFLSDGDSIFKEYL